MRTYPKIRKAGRRGFTLLEVVFVVMIVLVLSAITIPSLLRAKESANEAAATGSLRSITVGQVTYYALYQGYAPSLQALGPPKKGTPPSAAAAGLIDEQLASGVKGGYRFRYSALDMDGDGRVESYLVVGEPINGGKRRTLIVDQSGTVRSELVASSDRAGTGSTGGEKP